MSAKKYKMGDVREDGMVFREYQNRRLKDGTPYVYEAWMTKEKFEKRKHRVSNWYQKNRKRLLKMQSERYKKPEIKKRVCKYIKDKRIKSPQFAITCRVRCSTRRIIKKHGTGFRRRTEDLLGCSFSFLKDHIEKQFREGMSWDRSHSFHIDHIRPLASFDLTDPEQLKAACHWTNLQPLSPEENLRKSDKWENV
jgi:hypothetical protein